MLDISPHNQIVADALSADAQAWLSAHGAVFARVDADGVIEFSARPISDALTDAVAGLLPVRSGAVRSGALLSK